MAGRNRKRSSSHSSWIRLKDADGYTAATNSRAGSKKPKISNPADAAQLAPPSSQPAARMDAADVDVEDFDDDGHAWNPFASQVIRAVEQVKKPDHWPREFAKRVKDGQEASLQKLQATSEAMTASQQKFTSRFHTLIATALAPVSTEPILASQPLHVTHITPRRQPLYEKSGVLLEESKNLLSRYHKLAQQYSEPSRVEDLSQMFAADKAQTAQAIAAGRRVADADIDDMLADKLHDVRGRKAITVDDETLGRQVLQIGRTQRPETTQLDTESWGKVAYRAQKAVEKLNKVAVMDA